MVHWSTWSPTLKAHYRSLYESHCRIPTLCVCFFVKFILFHVVFRSDKITGLYTVYYV